MITGRNFEFFSLEDLRAFFGCKHSSEEQVEAFIAERRLRIEAGECGIPCEITNKQSLLVIHLVPISDFEKSRRIEIPDIRKQSNSFRLITWGSPISPRANLEGFCVHCSGNSDNGYTQIFRDGSIEAVSADVIKRDREGLAAVIPSMALAQNLVKTLRCYVDGLRALGASPPILVKISATKMQGAKMQGCKEVFPRPNLHLPASRIEKYSGNDYDPIVAEQMNFLFNAFGEDACPYFDKSGKLTIATT